jgi:diadenosine tetraphosphate (Ap4A) HIT family hydrolase
MNSCLFCKIIAGEIPAKMVHADDLVVVIEDIAPAAPQHFLILPRKHITSILDLTLEDDALVGHVHRVAARLAREKGFAESGFRVVVNTNDDGGQTVFHLHFHLLAGRRLTWPPG